MAALSMPQLVAIGLGGAAGSLLRYGLSTWVHGWAGRGFPYGTLAVNVLGCLAMGVLFVVLTERLAESAVLRAGLLVGLFGGFTTFSSFSIETFHLMDDGAYAKALANALANVVLCVGATWLGVVLARAV